MTQNRRLEDIRIGTPCPRSWNEMEGDEQRRFCDHCELHVHNTTALPRVEAEALLARQAAGDRLCMVVTRRSDGSVVTAEDRSRERAGRIRRAATWAVVVGGSLLAACRKPALPEQHGEGPAHGGGAEQPGEHERALLGEVVITGTVCPTPVDEVPGEAQGGEAELTELGELEILGDVLGPDEQGLQRMLGKVGPPQPVEQTPRTAPKDGAED